ncbi:glutamate receptor ionotropic, delta-1 [Nephila pilipes]|uniref:Glutamate receptor ionotropic, delta-1 n=1 Tax=Nephila pilipes TaxID=299642 RepID=A0A8X6Q8X0_NEPPI|nr:glutamate receptor ionotropic, delta-1 [Nephila pilipes]
MVHIQECIMYPLRIEFESRVMCMHAPNDDTMLFGTYSRFVHAFHTISRKKMWEICLNACVLSLCSHQRDGVKQVFAGLADGTLAVVENVQGRLPKPEVFYVVIGTIPVTCLQLVGRRLWCACGPNVIILSARTLDLLDQFQTSSNGLDYIYRMVIGEQGVWITLRGSSILQLWDPHSLTCRLLYDVRDNYNTRGAKVDETYTNHARITCVLPLESSTVVGTADGTLVFYDVVARKSPSPSAPSSPRPPSNAESGHAKQIQERLQKLLIEQQLMEGDSETKTQASDSPSSNLTPASNVSRRESSASSKDSGSDAVIEEEETTTARRSPSLQPPDERNPRLFGRGLRKTSFTISTPIVEEKGTKFDEGEEDEAAAREEEIAESKKEEPKEVPAPVPPKEEGVSETKQSEIEDTTEVPEEEKKRKSSEPSEFSRFSHIDAGDLVSSEGGEKVVSALEFQGASLKAAKKKYQSLSAEDIPTWVAQEKPQAVISEKGDVTFEYKSRLPSIKAFIRREANELATFLKGQQPQEQTEEPVTKSRNYPLFSIRPPTLDIADHQLPPKNILEEEPVEKPIPEPYQPQPTKNPPMSQPDSRRSSGIPVAEDNNLPPSYLASDEEFLSTAQFNDLLQLQDWTRTSRKGSDTASNVSFGSTEVAFAFELHLKEMIKISDKPIRSLLQAYCEEEMVIVSCAGYYSDDEAVLKWTREGEEKLWTNDPVIEVNPFTNTMKPSAYTRSRMPRRASIATTALATDVDFVACCLPDASLNTLLHYFISELISDLLHWQWVVLIGDQEKDLDPYLVDFLFQQNVSVTCLTTESKHALYDIVRVHENVLVILLSPNQVLMRSFVDSCRIKWVVLLPDNYSINLFSSQTTQSVESLYALFVSSDNKRNYMLQVFNSEHKALETINKWNYRTGFRSHVSFQTCSSHLSKPLRITMEKHFPFFRPGNEVIPPNGSDIELLNILSRELHFSYEISSPPDGSWGGFDGTEWTGMVQMLVKNQADAALSGMTITYDRYTAVQFSIPYAFDRITFVTKKPSRKPKTWAIFWPYTLQVWIFISLSVLMVSILMTLLRNALQSPKSYKKQFTDTALYMFQALLSQGYYNASETRCRILMAFWWIFCITVVAGYNGSLMSFMAHPGYNPSLDTVSQLVNAIRNRNFAAGTIQNSADYTVFRDSKQEELRVILDSMNSDPRNLVHHDVDGLAECLKRDYAYVGGELTVRADIWDPKLFLFAKDSFLQYGYAIAFAPRFGHINLFNHKIRQLQEGGIIVKWMEDIIEQQQFRGTMKIDKSEEDEENMHVLTVDDVQGAFAILSIGLILASIICTAEYQIHM